MKKTISTTKKILAILALLWLSVPAIVLGQTVTENELFPKFSYGTENKVTPGTKLAAVNALPKDDWQKTLTGVIKILLNISGGLTLLSFTVGGVMMIVSQGNGDLLEKGKKITYYSVAGLVIIAVSYALVIGVSELQFFTPGAGGGTATEGQEGTANSSQTPTQSNTPSAPGAGSQGGK